MKVIFSSARLYVREIVKEDFEIVYAINGDAEIMQYIRPVKTKEAIKEFIDENLLLYKMLPGTGRWLLVEKETKKIIGSVAVLKLPGTQHFHAGYLLFKQARGKGYATEVLKATTHYAFNTLCLSYILAIVHPKNNASVKVLYAAGFHQVDDMEMEGELLLCFRLNAQQ
jgi:[ribosomal protein S5]-alanine N-acetyltransferase